MGFDLSAEGRLHSQVFVTENKVNFQKDNKQVRIVLLCNSNQPMTQELAERIATKISTEFTIAPEDANTEQLQYKIVERNGEFQISRGDQQKSFKEIQTVVPGSLASKVQEISLRNLEKERIPDKKLTRLFNTLIQLVSSPFTFLYRAISSEQRALTQEAKDAVRLFEKPDQRSLCIQLEFVIKALKSENPDLKQALLNGRQALRAAEKASEKEKGKDPVKKLCDQWVATINSGEKLILPYATTDSHILIIKKNGDDIVVEDICLTQEDKKISAKKTYQLKDPAQAGEFFKELIVTLQPPPKPSLNFLNLFLKTIAPQKELDEILDEKEPKEPLREWLDNNAQPADVQGQQAVSISSSDDPLKLLYQLAVDLQPQGSKPPTKAEFYKLYVQQLISLYDSKADRLGTKKRIQLLEGLAQIADVQLTNVLTKEIGPIATEQVIAPFKNWINDKLLALKATSKLENDLIANLNAPAESAVIPLKKTLESVEKEKQISSNLTAYVDPALMQEIETLKTPNISKEEALRIAQKIDAKVNELIGKGQLAEARLLSISTLRAIPALDKPLWNQLNFEERKAWIQCLGTLSYHFSEAAALLGLPPQPFEALEIQIHIPLAMRALLDRQCQDAKETLNQRLQLKLQVMLSDDKYNFEEAKLQKAVFYRLGSMDQNLQPEAFKVFMAQQPKALLQTLADEQNFKNQFTGPQLRQLLEEADRNTNGQLSLDLWKTLKTDEERCRAAELSLSLSGYIILEQGGGGGYGLEGIQLLLQDSSLMIGGDPVTQARYNAAKNVYDTLSKKIQEKKELQELSSSSFAAFTSFAQARQADVAKTDVFDLQARFFGVETDKDYSFKELVPEEWRALAASEQLSWVVAAPGQFLHEGNNPKANQEMFIQKMADMQRVRLGAKNTAQESEYVSLALVDKGRNQEIAIHDVNHALNKPEAAIEEVCRSRQHYLGALPPRMIHARISDDNKVSGMSEPKALLDAKNNSGDRDPKHLFKMLEAGAINTEAEGQQQFSHHSVIHCFELILQYPYILYDPAVQHRLLQILTDRNVLETFLQRNPQFFVRIAPFIETMIESKLTKNDEISSALFLMDITNRIRNQAQHLVQMPQNAGSQELQAIAAWKPHGINNGKERLTQLFDKVKDPSIHANIAGYLLNFYSDQAPESLDVQDWKNLLLAKAIVENSLHEAGHPSALSLALHKLQEKHLPYLASSPKLQEVLNALIERPSGQWTQKNHYQYQLNDSRPPFLVDLQTGQGFVPVAVTTEEVALPLSLLSNPLFHRLFPALVSAGAPIVMASKRSAGADTIYEFEFNNVKYKATQTAGENAIRLSQFYQDNEYAYTEPNLVNPGFLNIARTIHEKGLWVNTENQRDIRLPAKGLALDENAYNIVTDKNAIKEISVGVGEEKKIVCAEVPNQAFASVIQCRPMEGMLFLRSKDSKEIDEIRFPEGLAVIKRDGKWKMKDNEAFEWQISDTADLVSRFGKEHSHWMMAFKHPQTQEQQIWIWPQAVSSSGKRGADLQFGQAQAVTPFLLNRQGQKESTSEAGWLYLAHQAYSRGNFALAVEYLRKMEVMVGKPFEIPRDQETINTFKQVAAMLLKAPPSATTAQKAFQLKLRLALAAKIEQKLPLSEQKNFFSGELFRALGDNYKQKFLDEIKQLKGEYDNFTRTPSQHQALKNEGLLLTKANDKAYANLVNKLDLSDKLNQIDQANKPIDKLKKNPPPIELTHAIEPSVEWEKFFIKTEPNKYLMEKVAKNGDFFQSTENTSSIEKAKNDALQAGLIEAAHGILESKGYLQIEASNIGTVRTQIEQRKQAVVQEVSETEKNILASARHYAEELGLTDMIAGKTLDNAKLLTLMLDKYQDGELDTLPPAARKEMEQEITLFLLASTEIQQLNKAESVVNRLKALSKNDLRAQASLDWALGSSELLRYLTEGSNRQRHCPTNSQTIDFKGRRYLVTEYRSENITRPKAKEAIEAMLDSDKKFVKVRMGLGKSTFIFPHLARFCIDRGYMPVVMFTEELLEQSRAHMDPKAFIFQFDRNFGIDPAERNRQKSLNISDDEIEINHLTHLYESLASLSSEGRYPITTPQRRAALRNKKIELCRLKSKALASGDSAAVQRIQQKIELIKRINSFFKQPKIRELHDEDVNLDISRDFDFALEESTKMDPVNVASAQYLMQLIYSSQEPDLVKLRDKILNRQLSAIPAEEFDTAVKALAANAIERFIDTQPPPIDKAWMDSFKTIPKEQLIDFLTIKGKKAPAGYPPYSAIAECKRFAALKTYLSETLPQLYKAQDNLDRGLAESNGCVIVPFQDGKEREGNRYGNSKEALIHAFMFYSVNGCSKPFFERQLRELRNDSMWSDKEEWKTFFIKLEQLRVENGKKTPYEAFLLPQAIDLRTQFLQHLIQNSKHYEINKAKINCNAQDVVLGNEINVASGTGDAFSLNLTEVQQNKQTAVIEGETYLKVDLTNHAWSFEDPLTFMKEMVSKPNVHAIMVPGYSIGNDTRALIAELRKSAPDKQFAFPDSAQNNRLMLWLPGAPAPIDFDRSRVDLDICCCIYGPLGTRGTDLPIKEGEDVLTINMVGPGSKEEGVNQSAWRPRKLGAGQKQIIAYQKSMEPRIRANNPGLKGPILAGHVMNDIKKESLEDVGNARVKAAVFDVKRNLKDFADRNLDTPLDAQDCRWDGQGIPLAVRVENALFESYQTLFIKEIEEDWENQYGETIEQDPVTYLQKLYEKEIRLATSLSQDCLFKTAELFVKPQEKEYLQKLRALPIDKPVTDQWIEQQFQTELAPYRAEDKRYKEEIENIKKALVPLQALVTTLNKIGTHREQLSIETLRTIIAEEPHLAAYLNESQQASFLRALTKYQSAVKESQKAQLILAQASTRLLEPSFKAMLKANLPEKIVMNFEGNQGSQVQVQQQQQQQQQMQMQQQQQIQVQQMQSKAQDDALPPPAALSLTNFIANTPNNQFSSDLGPNLSAKIPFHFKSARAKALLDANAQSPGQPLVYRLVVQDADGKIRTCLITPTDLTESIGQEMEVLKRNNPNNLRIGIYPLTKSNPPPLPPYDTTATPPDQRDKAFVQACAWDKLLIGWTEFTDEEMDFLRQAVTNLDSTDPSIEKAKAIYDYRHPVQTAFWNPAFSARPRAEKNNEQAEEVYADILALRDINSNNLVDFQDVMRKVYRLHPEEAHVAIEMLRTSIDGFGQKNIIVSETDPTQAFFYRNRKQLSEVPLLKDSPILKQLLDIPSERHLGKKEFNDHLIQYFDDLLAGKSQKEAQKAFHDWLEQYKPAL